jgi:integrase
MGIYKRKQKHGAFWRFDKMVKGVRLSSPYIYRSKAEAERAEWETIQKLLHPEPEEPKKIDLDFVGLCEKRLEWLQNHRGDWHFRQNKWVLQRLVKKWGNLPAEDLTTEMIEEAMEDWAQELMESGKDRYILNAAIRCGQALYNHPWGKRRGDRARRTFAVNPFASVDWYSVEKKAKYVPSQQVVNEILMAADPVERVLICLLRDTGARIGEAPSSQWIDVDLEKGTIDLFTRKKSDGSLTPRRIEFQGELGDLLRWWRKKNPRAEYLFQSTKNDHMPYNYTWAKNMQIRLCQRTGIEYFSLHCWRHYHASVCASSGMDLVKIQRRLGHENIKTTSGYLHELVGENTGG